jgi:DNA-binding NarL/FixJ family response regulator
VRDLAAVTQRRTPTPASEYPVIVIDDHELFSTSLCMALRTRGYPASQVGPGQVASVVAEGCPAPHGLAVLDLNLGPDANGEEISGTDLVRGLRAAGWTVLIVSGSLEQPAIAAAVAAGAIGSVPKSSAFDALLEAVIRAAAGRSVMSEPERQHLLRGHRTHQARERAHSERMERLSNREREVLELLAGGLRAAAIAERFGVSMTTVRTQIRSILVKLMVGSQLEAVALYNQQLAR